MKESSANAYINLGIDQCDGKFFAVMESVNKSDPVGNFTYQSALRLTQAEAMEDLLYMQKIVTKILPIEKYEYRGGVN